MNSCALGGAWVEEVTMPPVNPATEDTRKVTLDELYPGLVVVKPVFGRDGNMLLEEGVVLGNEQLQKLIIWDVDEVWVRGFVEVDHARVEREEQELRKGFIRTHERAVKSLTEVLSKMRSGQLSDGKPLDEHLHDIFDRLTLDRNLMLNMTLLSNVDNFMFSHCVNVAVLSMVCGEHLGYSEDEQLLLGKAGFMHDVGMVLIPREAWMHDRLLNEEERVKVREHTEVGYRAAQDAGLPAEVVNVVRNHHELADGSGYPRGLKGDEIDEFSRIVALANVYEGLTGVRPYRKENYIPAVAWRTILTRMKNAFDMTVLRAFMGQMAIYPIGSSVRLSTGEAGVVVGTNINKPFRPIVKIMFDAQAERLNPPQRLDLADERHWKTHITEPIPDNLITEALGL